MHKMFRSISYPDFGFPSNVFCFLLKDIFVLKSCKKDYLGRTLRLLQLSFYLSYTYFVPFTC